MYGFTVYPYTYLPKCLFNYLLWKCVLGLAKPNIHSNNVQCVFPQYVYVCGRPGGQFRSLKSSCFTLYECINSTTKHIPAIYQYSIILNLNNKVPILFSLCTWYLCSMLKSPTCAQYPIRTPSQGNLQKIIIIFFERMMIPHPARIR